MRHQLHGDIHDDIIYHLSEKSETIKPGGTHVVHTVYIQKADLIYLTGFQPQKCLFLCMYNKTYDKATIPGLAATVLCLHLNRGFREELG